MDARLVAGASEQTAVLDRWVLTELATLIANVDDAMEALDVAFWLRAIRHQDAEA